MPGTLPHHLMLRLELTMAAFCLRLAEASALVKASFSTRPARKAT